MPTTSVTMLCTFNVLTDTHTVCLRWAETVRFKGIRNILICSSASFQTWACPVIKILSKNDSLRALLQLFVAVGCRNASYRQERCFCFPYLRRKEVSLSSLYELIEGLPLSATATGKSHSRSEVPVVRGEWRMLGCMGKPLHISTTTMWRLVNSTDLESVTTPPVCARHFFLIAKSFILIFNK